MQSRQFSIRSILLTTFGVAFACTACRLYAREFRYEATGAAWLFALFTFLAGMACVTVGSILSAVRDKSSGPTTVAVGGTLMASAVPVGVVLVFAFRAIDLLART